MKSGKPNKKQPWFKDRMLLEDLYYIHVYDVDILQQRKQNNLYFQCVLYFRGK